MSDAWLTLAVGLALLAMSLFFRSMLEDAGAPGRITAQSRVGACLATVIVILGIAELVI